MLDRPVSTLIPPGSTVEVPQTPLSPGRTYSIVISATDKFEEA